ncbi:hypothetical protein, partial [Pseudomonas syringae group genomosp. 3]|uniref:hypothetical protein n=1 Tax=Pseudomonas syringae group genomosp. 3 TaxID=251701 RepID=UPI001C3F2567
DGTLECDPAKNLYALRQVVGNFQNLKTRTKHVDATGNQDRPQQCNPNANTRKNNRSYFV